MSTKEKLVLIDAARVILYANIEPLSFKEITNIAIETGLISSEGKTPEKSMAAMLYSHIKNKGSNSLFENVFEEGFTLTTKGKRDISRLKKHIAKFTPVLYVISNEAIPKYIKIGISTRAGLPGRIRSLSGTNVPLPFNLIYVFAHKKAAAKEAFLKSHYKEFKVDNREFYDKEILSNDRLYKHLIALDAEEIDINEFSKEGPSKIKDADNAPEIKPKPGGKAPQFTFEMLGIPVGSELTFKEHPEIKCTVMDNRNGINYKGKLTSTSALAREVRTALNLGNYPVQGSIFWEYEGSTLADIRNKLVNEKPRTNKVNNQTTKNISGVKALPLNFEMLKIPEGSELTFSNYPHIRCIVMDNKSNVNYEGEMLTLSGAAKRVRKDLGMGDNSVQGGAYWEYKMEKLTNIRSRLANERPLKIIVSNRATKPKSSSKTPPFTFEMLGIQVGSELTFRGRPNIICKVADNINQVNYQGETRSLSRAAKIVRTDLGIGSYEVQGGAHWEYQGETLKKRRERMGV